MKDEDIYKMVDECINSDTNINLHKELNSLLFSIIAILNTKNKKAGWFGRGNIKVSNLEYHEDIGIAFYIKQKDQPSLYYLAFYEGKEIKFCILTPSLQKNDAIWSFDTYRIYDINYSITLEGFIKSLTYNFKDLLI